MRRFRARMPIAALALVAALIGGCGSSSFNQPITTYRESYEAAAPLLGEYITEMNAFEREVYLHEVLYDDTQEILIRRNGEPTPLVHSRFSPEGLEARMNTIRLLGVYVERLAALAGADSPERFAAASSELGSSLEGLETQFRELGEDGDDTAPQYAQPIGNVVGAIGRTALEIQREVALRQAIEAGREPVNQVLALLEADFRDVVMPQQESGLAVMLTASATYYNTHREGMSFSERAQVIEGIEDLAQRHDALMAFDPVSLISAMRDANEALYRFAQMEDRDEVAVSELIAAMNTFAERVRSVAESIRRLRGEED